jgi:hypothetical protein
VRNGGGLAVLVHFEHDKNRSSGESPMVRDRYEPVDVILRMLVVKRLYHWSDEESEPFVADSLVRRQCCRLDLPAVPDDTPYGVGLM